MKTIRKVLILIILAGSSFLAAAQDFPMSVSLRGGYTNAVGFQIFTGEMKATEGLLSWRDQGIQLNVIRERYIPVFTGKSDHFFLCFGYGGHLGYEWRRDYHPSDLLPSHHFRSGPVIGFNGMAGLEYAFYKVPLSLGVQYLPYASFSTTRIFRMNLWDFGLVLRYRFFVKS